MTIKKILKICHKLIDEVQQCHPGHLLDTSKCENHDEYEWLAKNYFAIYRGILKRNINKDNIYLLKTMLQEQRKIKQGKTELKDSTERISTILAKKYNFNVDQQ